MVAEGARCSPGCAVQLRAAVARAVCATAGHLERHPVVEVARYRTPDDGHPHDAPVGGEAQAELMALDRAVVAVVLLDERIGFNQSYGADI